MSKKKKIPQVELAAGNDCCVAFAAADGLDSHVDCDGTGAAGGVERDRGAPQVEVVADLVGNHARDACEGAPRLHLVRLGDGLHVKGVARGVAADVLAAVVYSGVEEGEEGELDELPGADGHGAGILGGDAEFGGVEHADVLEEGAALRDGLPQTAAGPAINGSVGVRMGGRRGEDSRVDVHALLWDARVGVLLGEEKVMELFVAEVVGRVFSRGKLSSDTDLQRGE